MCAAALCHSRKCGKQHDHINIITGSACQDHLGNAFGCAVFFIHQLYHSWDNYSRGYRTHYSAHHSRFQSGNSQKIRCQQKVSQDSKVAGMQAIMMAGRPTFFRSARFRESPAFSRIMINAICRSSDEMDRIDGSNTFST